VRRRLLLAFIFSALHAGAQPFVTGDVLVAIARPLDPFRAAFT